MILYIVSGIVCSGAGILYTFRLSTAEYDNGTGLVLSVVAIVLLGGVSIFGGKGSMVGVVFAVLIYSGLLDALLLTGFPQQASGIVIGGLLLLSVLVPSVPEFRTRMRAWRHRRDNKYRRRTLCTAGLRRDRWKRATSVPKLGRDNFLFDLVRGHTFFASRVIASATVCGPSRSVPVAFLGQASACLDAVVISACQVPLWKSCRLRASVRRSAAAGGNTLLRTIQCRCTVPFGCLVYATVIQPNVVGRNRKGGFSL